MSPAVLARFILARELLVVALVDRALETLVVALEVEHPTLDDLDRPPTVTTLRHARIVVRRAAHLRRALEQYRIAVDAVIAAPDSSPEELPF